MKKGSLRVTSGRGLSIEFHAAREIPPDKGMKIELIGENARFELGTLQRPSSGLEVPGRHPGNRREGPGRSQDLRGRHLPDPADGDHDPRRTTRAPKIITGLTQYKLKEPKNAI